MLKVYTAPWDYHGENRLDISYLTGCHTFAPSIDSDQHFRYHRLGNKEFEQQYYTKMRESYKNQRDMWDWLLKQKEIVLVCDCNEPLCHRVLLANILEKLGAEDCGEIDKDGKTVYK
jgi:uncharacterized protein YeaO (DUF488 family)